MKIILRAFFLFLAAAVFSCSPQRAPGVDEKDPGAVNAEVFSMDAGVLDGIIEQSGRVLLVFWTTRCPYCVRSIPALNAFHEKYGGELALLGVNIGESADRVGRFAEERSIAYPVALDRDGSLARKFNVMGVPAYVLLGAGGGIEYSGHSLEEAKVAAGF